MTHMNKKMIAPMLFSSVDIINEINIDRLFFAHPYPTATNRHTEQPIYLWSPLEGIVADYCYVNDFSIIRMYWV